MRRVRSLLKLRYIITATLIAFAVWFAYGFGFIPSKAEREGDRIAALMKQHLDEPGEWVPAADIFPGEWTYVCVHPSLELGGGLNRRVLEKTFRAARSPLRFPNGIVGSSSRNWVLMLFYPPGTVEAFSISNWHYFGNRFSVDEHKQHFPGCRAKETALFGVRASSLKGQPHLALTLASPDQKQRIEELQKQEELETSK